MRWFFSWTEFITFRNCCTSINVAQFKDCLWHTNSGMHNTYPRIVTHGICCNHFFAFRLKMLIPARSKQRRLLVSKAIYPIWIARNREISSSDTAKNHNNTCSTFIWFVCVCMCVGDMWFELIDLEISVIWLIWLASRANTSFALTKTLTRC